MRCFILLFILLLAVGCSNSNRVQKLENELEEAKNRLSASLKLNAWFVMKLGNIHQRLKSSKDFFDSGNLDESLKNLTSATNEITSLVRKVHTEEGKQAAIREVEELVD